jgi:class 3 adenylate cyclase/tetratricopeptide (TPR) repeat protein
VNCASCGFANAAAARFCAGCGKPLEDAAAVPEVGERRQLTVLMCDLVGSTALSQALDSEDLRAMLTAYQRACSEVVEREEGYIAQYLGDGVVIYFGFLHAHEDDARRAVRCGLEILHRIQELDAGTTWPSGARLQVRIGADTGRVVVGGVGPQEHYLVHGDTPNIAARVQSVGDAGSLVVSDATWRLVQGYFRAESLGEVALKGIKEPMRLWLVTGTSGAESRLEMGGVLTEYVGRQQEHEALEAEWTTVTSGAARFVTVRGEAGIGKSRLVREFTQKLDGSGVDRLGLRFTPYSQHSAFLPVIELIESRLGFDATLSPEVRLDRIDRRMIELGIDAPDAAPLWAELLSVPNDGRYPPLVISPIRRRQRTLELLVAAVRALASQRPTVLVAEDLHWADPSTLEMLGLLVASASASTLPLLVLCTARPEFAPAWNGQSTVLIEVTPLDAAEVEAVARAVAGGKAMPGEVMREIAKRCDGVPLFVEEVTRAVIESGVLEEGEHAWELTGPLPPGLVPDSVEASLMARIDRLGDSRATAQLAATIGREFSYALLRAVSDRSEDALGDDLQNLVDLGLAWHLSSADAEKFVFKHALIQEVAYESLLRKNRQLFHRRIAAALQQQFPEVADEQPELIAQHLTGAGDDEHAIEFWEAAGERAVEGTAWHEAAAHFRQAIECLTRLPEDPRWLERELDLQNAITPVLMSVDGPGSSHVRDACERAHALASRLERDDKIYPSLAGFWYNHFLRGEMDEAVVAAREALRFAEASGAPPLRLTARRMTGYTHLERGEFEEALSEAEAGLALFDPEREREMVATFGNSMTASLQIVRATALWMLGRGDEAARARAIAIRFARDLDHVAVLAQALASWLHMSLCFEWYTLAVDEVVSVADEVRALCEDEGFVMWHGVATVYRGAAAAVQEDAPLADALIRDGLVEFARTGSRLTLVAMNVLCARARLLLGEPDEAGRHLDQAQIEADTRNERMWEPEIDRTRASLYLHRGDVAGAEASLRQALAKAHGQKARALELRAALDLHELLADNGRNGEVRALVEGLVSAFDRGSTQPEVTRAMALGLAAG